MELVDIIKYVVLPLLIAYVGYNEKDKRSMRKTIQETAPKSEIEKLIDLRMQVHQVEIREIKEDLARIERKLDKLLDRLSS